MKDSITVYAVRTHPGYMMHGTRNGKGGGSATSDKCTSKLAIKLEVARLPIGQVYDVEVNGETISRENVK